MTLKRTIGLILVIAGVILGVAKALGGESQSGDWTIRRSDVPGKVEFSLMDSRAGHHFHTSSDWPMSDFSGLNFSKAGRQEVHFTIARDAGKFECEGFLHDGEGAGLFHFTADPKYQQEMKSLGFERIDEDKQWAMAIHDVSLKFARDIKAQNLQGLDTDKLIAFKIHGVTPEFIAGVRAAGVNVSDSDKLIRHENSRSNARMGGGFKEAGLRPRGSRQVDCFPDSRRVTGFYRAASEAGIRASGTRSTDRHAHPWSDAGLHHRPAVARNEKPDHRSAGQPADSWN